MRVAKYDAPPENPGGRETLRFRFSDQELHRIGQSFGNGTARHLRFNLLILPNNRAKLVPTNSGGMAVTTSPSGKSYPWEIGFNHQSSPSILEVPAIPSSHSEMELDTDGILVNLPMTRRERRQKSREDARRETQERLQKLLEEANRTASELGAELLVSDGQVHLSAS